MDHQAKEIDTPVGPIEAPMDPSFSSKLSECSTREDLFRLVEPGPFIDPDALAEVRARGLYQEYQDWKEG
jgi:hypothetical protein